ncbi:MAG: protein kinase [Polyangiaceae bacterium]
MTAVKDFVIGERYLVREWLGQGGMGLVFRGVDRETGGDVAVKQLQLDPLQRDPIAIERFRREAQALEQLRHPNIVRVLSVLEEGGEHYLVMEYVRGGSLEDLLASLEAPLPVERVVAIALDLCDALTRTHRLGIVHRDLKPSNVLIAEDGSPRLTDFGAAYVEGVERLTRSSAIIGTTGYLSPEALSAEALDARVDIWAFGVLLFEMLTRTRPFGSGTVAQTLHGILFSSPPDLQALRPDCPPALVDLVYRMLAKDRDLRVPSARHVGAELEDIAQGRKAAPPAPAAATKSDAAAPLRNNLSAETTTFIGRAAELGEIERRVLDPTTRLLTILAPGGMGKTRTAVELGHRLIATALAGPRRRGEFRFPDGVFLVQLGPLSSADFIVSAIAEAVGLAFYAGREPKQQLVDYFRGRRALLLMDNFEHLLAGAELVNDLLQEAKGLAVVATSRERLGLTCEQLFQLPGMQMPDDASPEAVLDASAVRLFVQSARQQRVDFRLEFEELGQLVRICRLVEGIPLGIVLAASWAGSLTLQEIADEIHRSMDFLAAELRDLPQRQRSMRAVFDHSWALLNAQERAALARLSVFRGGFTRDAAEAVAGANLQSLAALMNKSLLRRDSGSGRYEAHELLRQYADRKLSDDAERHADAIFRHAEYFVRYLSEREGTLKGPQPRRALSEIEAELDNLRIAWAHLLEAGRFGQVALCAEALHVFHTHRASFGEGEATFRALGDALRQREVHVAEARLFGRALSFQASFLRQQGRYAQAEALLGQALELLDEQRHPRERAFALAVAGSTRTKTGNLDEGRLLVEQSLALFRTTDDRWGLSFTLETLGRIHGTSGDFQKSGLAFRESTEVQRAAGILQSGLMGLSVASVQQGDYAQGCRMMLEALEMFEQAGDVWNEMRCRMNLTNTQRTLGNYGSAETFARTCLAFWREVGNWDHEAWCYFQLGNIRKEQGLFDEARTLFDSAYERSLQIGDVGKLALAKLEFGGLSLVRGDVVEARRQLLESLAGFRSSGQSWGTALALDGLAAVALANGDFNPAKDYFEQALSTAFSLRLQPFVTNVVAGMAGWLARFGEPERALELIGLVQAHPATERHTTTRRLAPLLVELRGALTPEAFEGQRWLAAAHVT